jgi:hypothetical protein
MNVQLEPDEYRKLIELAYLGEWLVNSHHDPDFQDEAASQALQRVLEQYKGPDVDRDDETSEYFMQAEWTERLYDAHILDYDDHVFWEELTERLAQRDLARSRGVSIDEINRDDDVMELRPLEERYRVEFEDNGVERLEISGDYI